MTRISLDLDDDGLDQLVRLLMPRILREVRASVHRNQAEQVYLTTAQSCAHLGIGRSTFYKKVRGHLSAHDHGAGPRYLRSDLDRVRDEQRADA